MASSSSSSKSSSSSSLNYTPANLNYTPANRPSSNYTPANYTPANLNYTPANQPSSSGSSSGPKSGGNSGGVVGGGSSGGGSGGSGSSGSGGSSVGASGNKGSVVLSPEASKVINNLGQEARGMLLQNASKISQQTGKTSVIGYDAGRGEFFLTETNLPVGSGISVASYSGGGVSISNVTTGVKTEVQQKVVKNPEGLGGGYISLAPIVTQTRQEKKDVELGGVKALVQTEKGDVSSMFIPFNDKSFDYGQIKNVVGIEGALVGQGFLSSYELEQLGINSSSIVGELNTFFSGVQEKKRMIKEVEGKEMKYIAGEFITPEGAGMSAILTPQQVAEKGLRIENLAYLGYEGGKTIPGEIVDIEHLNTQIKTFQQPQRLLQDMPNTQEAIKQENDYTNFDNFLYKAVREGGQAGAQVYSELARKTDNPLFKYSYEVVAGVSGVLSSASEAVRYTHYRSYKGEIGPVEAFIGYTTPSISAGVYTAVEFLGPAQIASGAGGIAALGKQTLKGVISTGAKQVASTEVKQIIPSVVKGGGAVSKIENFIGVSPFIKKELSDIVSASGKKLASTIPVGEYSTAKSLDFFVKGTTLTFVEGGIQTAVNAIEQKPLTENYDKIFTFQNVMKNTGTMMFIEAYTSTTGLTKALTYSPQFAKNQFLISTVSGLESGAIFGALESAKHDINKAQDYMIVGAGLGSAFGVASWGVSGVMKKSFVLEFGEVNVYNPKAFKELGNERITHFKVGVEWLSPNSQNEKFKFIGFVVHPSGVGVGTGNKVRFIGQNPMEVLFKQVSKEEVILPKGVLETKLISDAFRKVPSKSSFTFENEVLRFYKTSEKITLDRQAFESSFSNTLSKEKGLLNFFQKNNVVVRGSSLEQFLIKETPKGERVLLREINPRFSKYRQGNTPDIDVYVESYKTHKEFFKVLPKGSKITKTAENLAEVHYLIETPAGLKIDYSLMPHSVFVEKTPSVFVNMPQFWTFQRGKYLTFSAKQQLASKLSTVGTTKENRVYPIKPDNEKYLIDLFTYHPYTSSEKGIKKELKEQMAKAEYPRPFMKKVLSFTRVAKISTSVKTASTSMLISKNKIKSSSFVQSISQSISSSIPISKSSSYPVSKSSSSISAKSSSSSISSKSKISLSSLSRSISSSFSIPSGSSYPRSSSKGKSVPSMEPVLPSGFGGLGPFTDSGTGGGAYAKKPQGVLRGLFVSFKELGGRSSSYGRTKSSPYVKKDYVKPLSITESWNVGYRNRRKR